MLALGTVTGKTLIAGSAVAGAIAVVAVIAMMSGDDTPVVGGAPGEISTPKVPSTPVATAAPKEVLAPKETGEPAVKTSEPGSETAETTALQPDVTISATDLTQVTEPDSLTISVGSGEDSSISADRTVETELAYAAPSDSAAVSTESADRPTVGTLEDKPAPKPGPRFDIVRIDKHGSAVVAGKAAPGELIDIYVDDDVVAEVVADKRGSFVALFDVEATGQPQVLRLAMRDSSGAISWSRDRVLVMGREVVLKEPAQQEAPTETASVASEETTPAEAIEEAPPAIIIASDEGIRVVQPLAVEAKAPDAMANVTLDLISYDDEGEVVLTGRSESDKHVRVYVDDEPVKTGAVNKDGSWKLSLPEVNAGRYTLRVDEIDGEGQVTSRIETPFQKEIAEDVKRQSNLSGLVADNSEATLPQVQRITIQTGATLWALAEQNYGDGNMYLQIFQANLDTIRDPNLIYPGQIFTIPD